MKKSLKITLGIIAFFVVLLTCFVLWVRSLPSSSETVTKTSSFIQKSSETEAMKTTAPKEAISTGDQFVKDFFTFNPDALKKWDTSYSIEGKIIPLKEQYGTGKDIEYQLKSSTANETSIRLNYSVTGIYHDKKEEFAMIVNLSKTDNQLTLTNFSVVDLNE